MKHPTKDRNIELERRRSAGETYVLLAKEHGVTPSRVRQIVHHERWLRNLATRESSQSDTTGSHND